jgi:hypothetical protein
MSTPRDRSQFSKHQEVVLDVLMQIRDRLATGEDSLVGVGERMQAPDTASLPQKSAAVTAGARYLFVYDDGAGGVAPGNPCFVRLTTAAGADATNAAMPVYHGERRYVRVPTDAAATACLGVLFPDTASFGNLIQSDERSED